MAGTDSDEERANDAAHGRARARELSAVLALLEYARLRVGELGVAQTHEAIGHTIEAVKSEIARIGRDPRAS